MASATPDLRLPSRPQSTAVATWLVLISGPAEGRRLGWRELLVTPRLYDWSVCSEHLGFLFLVFFISLFCLVPCGRIS